MDSNPAAQPEARLAARLNFRPLQISICFGLGSRVCVVELQKVQYFSDFSGFCFKCQLFN